MSFTSLERRVAALERPLGIEKPPEELALEVLTDNETGLVTEFVSLLKAGYALEQIRHMMEAESYEVAVEAITRADTEYRRLTAVTCIPQAQRHAVESCAHPGGSLW
jgi:hypothetical protein